MLGDLKMIDSVDASFQRCGSIVLAFLNLNLRKNQIDNSEDQESDALFRNGMLMPLFRQAYQWVM